MPAAEQGGVGGTEATLVCVGLLPVSDVAPGRGRITAAPGAAPVPHHQCPPQAGGHCPDLPADRDAHRLMPQADPAHGAVAEQAADGREADRPGESELDDALASQQDLLLRDHEHLRTLTVLGRCLADPQRHRAELLEGVGATLFGRTDLAASIRTPEGVPGRHRDLGLRAVQATRGDHRTVRGLRQAEGTALVLATLAPLPRVGVQLEESATAESAERNGVHAPCGIEELGFELRPHRPTGVSEQAGDRRDLLGVEVPVASRLVHRRRGSRLPTGRHRTLGFTVAQLQLRPQEAGCLPLSALLGVAGGCARLAPPGVLGKYASQTRSVPVHTVQLRLQATQRRLQLRPGELIHLAVQHLADRPFEAVEGGGEGIREDVGPPIPRGRRRAFAASTPPHRSSHATSLPSVRPRYRTCVRFARMVRHACG